MQVFFYNEYGVLCLFSSIKNLSGNANTVAFISYKMLTDENARGVIIRFCSRLRLPKCE